LLRHFSATFTVHVCSHSRCHGYAYLVSVIPLAPIPASGATAAENLRYRCPEMLRKNAPGSSFRKPLFGTPRYMTALAPASDPVKPQKSEGSRPAEEAMLSVRRVF
jgi:hypothetical protein